MAPLKHWQVYLIKTTKGKYYTGISTDPERRFQEHLKKKGAKFFYSNIPQSLYVFERNLTRSKASSLEAKIKQLTHTLKAVLVSKLINEEPFSWGEFNISF